MAKPTCKDKNSVVKALVFQQDNLSVIQGASTLLEVCLKDFFIACDTYLTQDIVVPAGSSIDVSPGNLSTTGEVEFVGILATYPKLDTDSTEIVENDKYLTWNYPSTTGPDNNMGKIMFLSGTNGAGLGWDLGTNKLTITNPHAKFDVKLKIVIVN